MHIGLGQPDILVEPKTDRDFAWPSRRDSDVTVPQKIEKSGELNYSIPVLPSMICVEIVIDSNQIDPVYGLSMGLSPFCEFFGTFSLQSIFTCF
jgi:hypothetical protein